MQSDRKLAQLVNPSSHRSQKNLPLSKLIIQDNNRSISHLILLSKTQPSFSRSTNNLSGLRSPKQIITLNPNLSSPPQTTSQISKASRKGQFSEFLGKLARKKLDLDKESKTQALHFDISHQLDKPYFKTSPKPKPFLRVQDLYLKEANILKEKEKKSPNEKFNEYRYSLLKEVPFALSEKNPPGSRLEQKMLKKWLERQKSEIEEKYIEVQEQLKQKNIVYGLIFEELKRQIGCYCNETGELFSQLWEFERDVKAQEIQELESKMKKELKLIRRDYEEQIKDLETEIGKKDKIIAEKQEKIEDMILDAASKNKNLMKIQDNEQCLATKLTDMRKMLTFLRRKSDWLTKENENLLMKVEKRASISPLLGVEKPESQETIEEDSSAEEEKILIDIKDTEGKEEHDIQDLNQVIVACLPEVKDIKRTTEKSTSMDPKFYLRYTQNIESQTELALMDKLFEKNLKNTPILQEMCLDYQYKQQIKDLNSGKFRKSIIAEEKLIEKITGMLESQKLFKEELKASNDLKEEPNSAENSGSEESEVLSRRNSYNNLENPDEKSSLHPEYHLNPEPRRNLEEESEPSSPERKKTHKNEESSENNLKPEIKKQGSHTNSDPMRESLYFLEKDQNNKINLMDKGGPKTDNYLPSIALPKTEEQRPKPRMTAEAHQIVRVRVSPAKSIASNRSNDIDFEKVIALFKSENVKAQDFEEKYKRNLEMLKVENLQRKKLEAKNQDLHATIEFLQNEIDKLRKSRDSTMKLLVSEKRRVATQLDKLEIREKLANEISEFKEKAKLKRKKEKKTLVSELKTPILGQHISVEYEHQKQNLGSTLLEKIKNKKIGKFHNFMHLKLVLKQIHMIYFERITQTKENPSTKEQDFASYVYTFFLSLFGLKQIADKRFIILILSVKKHLSFYRVSIFSRFLGLMDPNQLNFSTDELNKYIEALDFMLNVSTLGTTISNNDADSKFYVPYIRAVQYTSLFADTRMTAEENGELKREIETLKETDSKNINKAGVIDFDAFMEKILIKYKILVNRAKTYVINAFAACDLDGNKMCNQQEFLLLNRHIEAHNYDEERLEKIFINNADIEKDREKNLSFDKFSVVCVEYNLFTDEAQDRYLGVTKKVHLEIKMQEILETWAQKRSEISQRFDGLTILSKIEMENWMKIISVLDERITGKTAAELKPTLIAYKMLEEESKRLVVAQKKYEEEGDFGEEDDEIFNELADEGEGHSTDR